MKAILELVGKESSMVSYKEEGEHKNTLYLELYKDLITTIECYYLLKL